MKAVYICSTRPYSGKSLVTLGLGLRMEKDGFKVGYMKPFGRVPVSESGVLTDEDASFMRSALGLDDPLEKICPVVYSHDLFMAAMKDGKSGKLKAVMSAFGSLSRGRDAMIVCGTRGIHDGSYLGISGVELVGPMDAGAVIIDPFDGEVCIDCVLSAKRALGDRLIGMVINRAPQEDTEYLRGIVGPYLKRKGIPLLGILPVDKLLNSITVGQLADTLGGAILCRQDMSSEMVENFLIGAMEVESALKYFRRTPNKAVITGGHRSDILLAALETSTKCLVLTGNMQPNELILDKAKAAGVPMILVKHDTMSTMERVEGALGKVRIRGEAKVKRASRLMDSHFDFKSLYKLAGLKKSKA